MKKILSIFMINFLTTISTTNCISCANSDEINIKDVKTKILDDQNIIAKGANLDPKLDSQSINLLTTKNILNDIGLSSEEQSYVSSLSGTLIENKPIKLTFNLRDEKTNFSETINQNVTWWKKNQDSNILNKNWYNTLSLNNGTILISGEDGLYQSTDNSYSFFKWSNDIPSDNVITTILQTTNDNIYVGTIDKGLYRSTDEGKSFWLVDNEALQNSTIYSLSLTSKASICVGTNIGLYKSFDDGKTFEQNETIPNDDIIYSLLQTSEGNIYAGTNNGLYRSDENYPDNFILLDNENNQIPTGISVFSLLQTSDGYIYVGEGNELYITKDNGKTFAIERSWLHNSLIYSLFQASDENIYVGTQANGLYKLDHNDNYNLYKVSEVTFDTIGSITEINNTLFITDRPRSSSINEQSFFYLAI